MSDATLTIPGLIFIGADGANKNNAVVHLGTAVGWTIPRGIHTWSRELSVVMKADLTPQLLQALGVVLPEQQGDPEFIPRARSAAQACSIVAVEGPIADQLTAKGVRVHTVGFDRVSNGFFYFASGGTGEPRRVQGELIEIIAASLDGAGTREELDARLDGLIDRLIGELSAGALSEAQLELAEALPPLAPKGDKSAAKLQTLEGWLILAGTRSSKFEDDARRLAETLRGATRRDADVVQVPLFSEARRVVQPELDVEITDGDAGKRSRLTLPARTRWFVTGEPSSVRPPAAKPTAAAAPASAPLSSQRPTPRAADDGRVAAEKAAAEKAAADRAAAEKAAAERAAAARAAEKAAADRAAAERAAADRVASERAAAERAAAERAAAERAAAERAAAERVAAERAAAERAAAERAAAERAAAERAAAEKGAAERAAAQQAAEQAASQRAVAVRPGEKAALSGAPSSRPAPKKDSLSIVFLVLMLLVGAAIGAVLRLVRR